MIIETFDVECFLGERRVYEMSTVFGFFPKEAFENQVGLPASDEERARITAPSRRRDRPRVAARALLRRRRAARPARCC